MADEHRLQEVIRRVPSGDLIKEGGEKTTIGMRPRPHPLPPQANVAPPTNPPRMNGVEKK